MVSPKGEIDNRPKRFYREVGIVGQDDHWSIQLDGKSLRTPEKKLLVLPTGKLADVIADEWRAQGERIDLQGMFNTRLANVVLDRTPASRGEFGREAARYAHTDLVCHLAEAGKLQQLQEESWAPLRTWAADKLGVRLDTVEGVIACAQPERSIDAVRAHAATLDDWRLTGLVHAIAFLGSAVLGLAVERRRITAAQAFEVSRIDEAFQAAQWGEDAEAVRRTERHRTEAKALDLWFDALPL